MSEISLAIGGGARRMTYVELAAVRGISPPSARRLVLRHRWPRQKGNDGVVHILVPLRDAQNPRARAAFGLESSDTETVRLSPGDMSEGQTGVTSPSVAVTAPPDVIVTVRALESAIGALCAQLEHERARADRAEQRLAEALTRQVADSPPRSWWRLW